VGGRRAHTEGSCYVDKFTAIDPETELPVEQTCTIEKLGSRMHPRGDVRGRPVPEVKSTQPPGQVFLVSDNRMLPYDSRDFGPVDRTTCKEKVFFRLVGTEGFKDVASRFTFIQ
jgi:type IV secretory pathway protease TraF